jgi:uncharacterized RDD family membrane protein YckC
LQPEGPVGTEDHSLLRYRRLDFAEGWRPAGFVRRLVATLLDMAMYCGLCALLALPVSQKFDWGAVWGGIDQLASAASDPQWLAHASGILGLWIALWWCYFVVGWGLFGATPGKWAVGLRITDYRQRCPVGPSRGLLRLAAYCVSSVTFEWGHLLMLIRFDRRTLHDILAGTRVVRRSKRAIRVAPEEETEPDVDPDPVPDPDPENQEDSVEF